MIDLGGRPAAEVVFQDISDRKRSERQAREREEREQRALKLESLGALAAGIAHDFNNILVGVMGHADLALEYLSADSPAGLHVEELGKGAQHAADLAQQLLDYAGEKRAQATRLDLSGLVREMDRLLRVSVQKRAQLDVRLGDELPRIEGEPTQLRQVAMNLILNAADAIAQRREQEGEPNGGSGLGRITVRTYLEPCQNGGPSGFHDSFLPDPREVTEGDTESDTEGDKEGDESCHRGRLVVLDVADDGCGMDEASKRRVFEPFYSTKPAGRGLGMATVLGILRAHKGAVDIETAPGEGTRIRVAFPAIAE
jgi:signal transduction histidine kinase